MADEKYRTQLTGAQVDDALQQLNQRVAEGWAVGTRDGSPVGSGSEYYHNNARYYAQQAQSIAPASVTEAVRWDIAQTALTDANRLQARENINAADNDTSVQVVTQSFTPAQQEIARANIAAGRTNPNLLDNPFFTINQRNVAVGVNINGNGFVADRWQATGTIGATRNSDGSLTIADTLYHKIPTALELDGKTVTLSVLYADGTTEANTFPWSGTSTKYFTYGRAAVYASAYQINFNGFTKDVKAFKLELGSVSTLANDTPPDYGTELAKCQYYFERKKIFGNYGSFGTGVAVSTTNAEILIPMHTKRNTSYTIATSGSFAIMGGGAITSIAKDSGSVDTLALYITTTGLTAGQACLMRASTDPNAYIDILNDL